ncbi:hypothetical protein [Flavobacterium sp.]|uniref:hypothetical protein n=1 Tax=Flavobacterium sp. TaxID=239 RepID=UPI00261F9BCF|nr:hypothetical protein [Flavobacterium sp.]
MQIVGRFFALPNAREYEIHSADGSVIFGKIHEGVSADLIGEFNASNRNCTGTVVYVGRQHPMLIEIKAT